MILVRDIFQLKFGRAKEAIALWKEGASLAEKYGYGVDRILTDKTGPYYTLVMESTYESLTDYEKAETGHSRAADWRAWYDKFVPLVESGRREMFSILDLSGA
jgi:hypothetical protein